MVFIEQALAPTLSCAGSPDGPEDSFLDLFAEW